MSPVGPELAAEDSALVVSARPVYTLGRNVCRTYLALLHRFRVIGREHLPSSGGVLIVANHQSFLDIPILAAASPRHVAFVARASLARSRFLDFLMRESGCVLIRPNTPDRAALEGMIAHLERGDCVGVFPEGTRTSDGTLGVFKAGAGIAARRTGVPIVPAAIRGAFRAWPRQRALPRPTRIELAFAPPLAPGTEQPIERARAAIAELVADGGGPAR